MAGRFYNTQVYGRGTIEESRRVCAEKNSTLPWQTFTINHINVTSGSIYRFIKKGAFWLNTSVTTASEDGEIEKKIGAELDPKLREVSNQTADLILRPIELGKERTYCAIRCDFLNFVRYNLLCFQ